MRFRPASRRGVIVLRRRLLAALATPILLAVEAPALAADTGSLTVAAVIPSKSNCKFNFANLPLAFGTINPAQTVPISTTATGSFVCNGSSAQATFLITANDGQNATGAGQRRMQHQAQPTNYLRYGLAWTPTSATVPKGVNQTLTVTGTVQPEDFSMAVPGAYQDIVVLTIAP